MNSWIGSKSEGGVEQSRRFRWLEIKKASADRSLRFHAHVIAIIRPLCTSYRIGNDRIVYEPYLSQWRV